MSRRWTSRSSSAERTPHPGVSHPGRSPLAWTHAGSGGDLTSRGGKGSVHRSKLVVGLALCVGLLAPGSASAKTTLVAVPSDHATINRLEALGLDVTYEGDGRTEVMLHGSEDAQILTDTGIATTVLDDDIDGENDAWIAAEAAKQKRRAKGVASLSTLPT